ncbi:MAG: ATP-binding protein [Sphingomonas sp.]
MTRPALWPTRLSSQMALLIAIALFVAQAINLGLLLEGRRQLRLQQVVGPAVTRIVDANERITTGQWVAGEARARGRMRLVASDPVSPGARHAPDVEAALRTALVDAGMTVGQIRTDVRRISPSDQRIARFGPALARRYARFGAELVIALELPGHGWLVLSAPWSLGNGWLFWQLLGQTLILYGIVLVPVLWAARHISRPLQALAGAARDFTPGGEQVPLAEHGPQDVRAVTSAFNALRLRVSAMLDEKDRMLGAIGHDLRTPLAALRVRIESVEDETDRTRMAETIDEMNHMLDDILSLARLGRPSEPLTDVELSSLVDAVVEDFRALGAPVEMDEAPRVTLRLRPSLMRRAVRNLIENAVKYGEQAQVRVVDEPGSVAIIVADTGPGIPPERMEAVFTPFTRLEESRNRETGGIGLGLALARAIVQNAGGVLELANRKGGGLDATITLPRASKSA